MVLGANFFEATRMYGTLATKVIGAIRFGSNVMFLSVSGAIAVALAAASRIV